jgi:hypothetical protein
MLSCCSWYGVPLRGIDSGAGLACADLCLGESVCQYVTGIMNIHVDLGSGTELLLLHPGVSTLEQWTVPQTPTDRVPLDCDL